MIAISLWQPWATALLLEFPDGVALKPDETRHWDLPARCVGVPVAIHAAQREDKATRLGWEKVIEMHHDLFREAGFPTYFDLPRGAVIGVVRFSAGLDALAAKRRLVRGQHLLGDYDRGRFAWPTTQRLLLKTPIPTVGRQGFFKVPVDLPA